jgi:hypothetical protein
MRWILFILILISPMPAYAGRCKGVSRLRCENILANRFRLKRLANLQTLKFWVKQGILVNVPDSGAHFYLDERLGERDVGNRAFYKYIRPTTRDFICKIAADFSARFGGKIKITSLVRTREYQKRLRRNPNAAPPSGGRASTHLTGATFDLSFREMSAAEAAWTWGYLRRGMLKKRLYAIRERYGGCFHIFVFPAPKRR